MDDPSLAHHFARFRDAGDLDALAAVFDETAPRLLAVARHLVPDEVEAEDLVQATFVSAIEKARSFDAQRALIPWLTGILTNKAKQARERGRRDLDPSRVTERTPAEDPVRPAEVAEFLAALERALDRVPEAYRSVVRLHLAEGRSAGEIATSLGRRRGTVRVQLHRGLRHLRRALPAGFALGGAVVVTAPRGHAELRRHVLDHAARTTTGAGVSTGTALLGGMLMGKKLVLGVVALLAVAATWWGVGGFRKDSASNDARAGKTTAVLSHQAPRKNASVPSPTETASMREPVDLARADGDEEFEPYGTLSLQLLWWDGSPVAGVAAKLLPWSDPQPYQAFRWLKTDTVGRATVDRVPVGEVVLELEPLIVRSGLGAGIAAGETTEVIHTIPRGIDVRGRVVDSRGGPVQGAAIWAASGFPDVAFRVGTSESDGSFLMRSLGTHGHIFATHREFGDSQQLGVGDLPADETGARYAELKLDGVAATLRGTVTDEAGQPLGAALVVVRCSNTMTKDQVRNRPFCATTTSAEGSFLFEGLVEGTASLWAIAPKRALATTVIGLKVDLENRADFQIGRGATIRGTLTSSDGATPARGGVRVESDFFADELNPLWANVGEDGKFVLQALPAGKILLIAATTVEGDRIEQRKRFELQPGDDVRWDVVFGATPAIHGRIVSAAGQPLADWKIHAMPPRDGGFAVTQAMSDDKGWFELPGLLLEPYHLVAYPPGGRLGQAQAQKEGVVPSAETIELVVQGELEATSFVVGRVIGPDGEPVRATSIWARRTDGLGSVGDPIWEEGDVFRVGPMFAGTYDVNISVPDFPGRNLRGVEVLPGEEHDLGDVILERPGRVELVIVRVDGGSLAEKTYPMLLQLPGQDIGTRLHSDDGTTFLAERVRPGSHRLSLGSPNSALSDFVTVEVLAGQTTSQEVRCIAGRRVYLRFQVPEGEELPPRLHVRILDEDDRVFFDRKRGTQQTPGGGSRLSVMESLPFGAYHVEASSEEGWHVASPLMVSTAKDDDSSGSITLVLSLARED